MKIGIDARFYGITGIGRYAKNLIKNLEELDRKNNYAIFLWKKAFDAYHPQNPNFKKVLADYPLYSFVEQIRMPILIRRERIDLMHFTNFNVPVFYFGKYVMTVHDLIHMEYSTFGSTTRFLPYYLLKKFIYSWAIRWAAWRAQKIFVPSEDAKNDVVRKLWVKPEKVVVTYEGIDEKLKVKSEKLKVTIKNSKFTLDKYKIKKPYLLYVGTMYPHKNHEQLLLAFKNLLTINNQQSTTRLVLVAKVDFFSKRIKEKVAQMGLFDSVVLPGFTAQDGYVPDDDLKIIYQNADAYVFPSLKEGFGLPILEAFAAGVPVVCSNASSLPEVAGGAAIYFDPYNIDDILKKVELVLVNKELRNELVQKGYKRLRKFSWNEMAKKTLNIYEQIRKS
ncbi:MAG: glycosyltransferase family 4 protein [Candidatus Cloacimonetes bacterium]|nr:glycosyltransferase family 4 protein [Candidatus Cloacimonadota bacterium]